MGEEHHGKAVGWSWGLKIKVFCHHHRSPCMPPSKPKVAGRCSLQHAFDVANTSHRGSVPHGRGLADVAPVFSKCDAVCMFSRTKLGSLYQPRANSAEKQFICCHSTDYT